MRHKGDIVLIIDRGPLRKARQHYAPRPDLTRADKKLQFAGADGKNSAQYCSALNDRGKGDNAFVVNRGNTEAVKDAAARSWIASRHEFAQHATAVQIQCLERFPAPPDSSHKGDFIAIVEHRRIEFDKGAISYTGRVRPGQCNSF